MSTLSFDDFTEECWDYVSEYIISDKDWENNKDFIRETTFDIYRLYLNSEEKTIDGKIHHSLPPKLCGKLLEIFLSNLLNHKFIF